MRQAVVAPAPEGERHLSVFEGRVIPLPEIDVRTGRRLVRLGGLGFQEVVHTPSGLDVPHRRHS